MGQSRLREVSHLRVRDRQLQTRPGFRVAVGQAAVVELGRGRSNAADQSDMHCIPRYDVPSCCAVSHNGTYQPGSLESKSPCRVRPRRVSPDRMPQGLRHWLSAHFNNAVPSAIVDLGLLVCPRRHAPEMKCWHQPKHLRSFPLTTATRGCRSGSLRGCRLPPSPRPPRPVEREARPTAQARSRQAFFARGCRNPCRQHCSQARMLERAAPRASEADLIAPRPRARHGPQTRTGPCLMRRLHEADDPFVRATLEPNSSYTISIDEPDAFNTAPLADF